MHWIVICRDKPDMEATRLATRAAHRAYIWRDDLPARLLTGAPLAGDDGQHLNGTWLLLDALDRAAVKAFLADDPYQDQDLFASVDIHALFDGYDSSVILPPAHKRQGQG